jgi:hypothetical protein
MNSSTDVCGRDTPGYVVAANVCGIGASVLLGVLAFYVTLYAVGQIPEPPMGVMPIWTMTIVLLAMVKVAQWIADKSAERTRALIERRYGILVSRLDSVSTDALTAAQEAGRWKGVATTLREAQQEDTGEIISLNGRRRQG